MGDVENMSDAELRTKLMEFGFPVMPITGTTRKLMMKKLKLLMENKNKSPKDGRLSLGRYSSEEESDTDVKSSKKDKNRRITMAAPPPQTPNRSGVTLRKSLHRNNNEEITMPSVSKDGLKSTKHITTTTKITKSVQDEFDTGSDSEPEIIENDYDSTPNITNSYGFRKEMAFSPSSMLNFENSSTKYARPQTVTSHFSSNYASSSTDKPISSSTRYTSYNSSTGNSGDATLDRLNQIRSRLSLGNQGFDRSTYSSTPDINKDKTETPFLSNFTRRLSQLSSNNSPKSDYDYKNDIIKEHDTNGAGAYNRIYTGRSTRYRDINRDYYSRHNTSIMKNNMIPLTLIGVACLFFCVVAIMYYGMRSDDKALETTGYIIPRCNRVDTNAKPGINCVRDEDLENAIYLMKTIKPELLKRAIDFACKVSSDKPYMTEMEVINYSCNIDSSKSFTALDLDNMEVLAFKNPDWEISIIRTNLNNNILNNMADVIEYRKLERVGLSVLNPSIPWHCTIYNKIHAIFNFILLLVSIFFIFYFGNILYKYVNHREQQKCNEIYSMVKQIIETLQSNSGEENEFLVINHVRDMILPINNRKYMEKTWDEAVKFINENESRVRTEVQIVQGEPYEVWRWLGSPNLNVSGSPRSKTWQGQAFETQVGSVNSLPCSPTPCLKIRGMVDDNDSNLHGIREAVLSKCAHQCRILHCAIDTTSKCVYLKCADQNDAAVAYRSLHGWWYAGHLVTVKYLRLERYMQRFPDSPTQGPPFLQSLSPATDWSS